jgi:hypothetical protein
VGALVAAYRLGNPTARIGCWPQQAMDMWRGTPAQVQSRLLAVEQLTEPFYQRVASAALRLALTAPDVPPVDGSDELLRRLDVDELAALWEGRPLQLKDIEAIADHLPGARLRYADFFAALAGAFDRGHWSYEDVDLAVLTVPTLLSKAEADAAMRVVLEDYGHYATGRKPEKARTPCWSWTSSAPSPAASTARSTWPNGSGTSASRSWSPLRASRASGITARRPGCWPRVPAGSWSSSARTPSGSSPWPAKSGRWSTTGSWTSTAPAASPRPAWGSDPGSTRGRPPGPARRSMGHPGRPAGWPLVGAQQAAAHAGPAALAARAAPPRTRPAMRPPSVIVAPTPQRRRTTRKTATTTATKTAIQTTTQITSSPPIAPLLCLAGVRRLILAPRPASGRATGYGRGKPAAPAAGSSNGAGCGSGAGRSS